jgi:CrcB protein
MNAFLGRFLAVGIAGFFGSIARWLIALMFNAWFSQFPVGTLVINLSGSLLLGWFYGYAASRIGFSATWRVAIGTGFVGAYTTFSTFMYESDALMRQGAWLKASANLIGSLVLGLLAVRLGAYMASR